MPIIKSVYENGCDSKEYERTQATLRLMEELSVGRKSGEENGWLSLEEMEKNLGIRNE